MKAKLDNGTAPECFAREFVEAGYRKKGIDEAQAAFVAGSRSSLLCTAVSQTSLAVFPR